MGVTSGCQTTSRYDKPGETPSKLAGQEGLGAVSGARKTIIVSITRISCQETYWNRSGLLLGEGMRVDGVRCLHVEPQAFVCQQCRRVTTVTLLYPCYSYSHLPASLLEMFFPRMPSSPHLFKSCPFFKFQPPLNLRSRYHPKLISLFSRFPV